jgi:hypothetical protein
MIGAEANANIGAVESITDGPKIRTGARLRHPAENWSECEGRRSQGWKQREQGVTACLFRR